MLGAIASLVTPFSTDGELDRERLSELSNHLSTAGFDGLCFAGGTGEFLSLSQAEREAGLSAVVAGSNGKPVLASALYTNPNEVLRSAEVFARIGAAAIMIMPPYFYAPTQEAVEDHVAGICKSSPLPVLLFNSAARAGRTMSPSTVINLAREHSNIIGIKETTEKVAEIEQLVALSRNDFRVLQANETLVLSSYAVGATGSFGSLCNVIPKTIVRLHRYLSESSVDAASVLTHEISRVSDIAYSVTVPVGIKHLMQLVGRSNGIARPPLNRSLNEDTAQRLASLVDRIERLEAAS